MKKRVTQHHGLEQALGLVVSGPASVADVLHGLLLNGLVLVGKRYLPSWFMIASSLCIAATFSRRKCVSTKKLNTGPKPNGVPCLPPFTTAAKSNTGLLRACRKVPGRSSSMAAMAKLAHFMGCMGPTGASAGPPGRARGRKWAGQ
eukprot:CAMPEP_0171599968 /NCGR_PEP_ID=MMETSP0990-20121206/4048_1 /TAXON_ID=483369 /ORGANISM="non described non described, Strain CCMP2098" /LENGTH=145 /DNA_ID=CAMNT_0012161845 /DNA_START=203 /DNA_END=641 /DNA_ORIENTATION=-